MNDKMQVIVAKQTGHVLAAFTRMADPGGKPSSDTPAGNGLFIRRPRLIAPAASGGEEVFVPAGALDVLAIMLDPKVFSSPLDYVVNDDQAVPIGTSTVTLNPGSPPLSSPEPPALNPPEFRFSTTRVTVQIASNTAEDKSVCVVVQEVLPPAGEEPVRRIAQGVVVHGSHFVSLDWKINPDSGANPLLRTGNYYILALLAGYKPLFGRQPPAL